MNRFSLSFSEDDPDELEDEPHIAEFLAAIAWMHRDMNGLDSHRDEKLWRDHVRTAEEMSCSVFAAAVFNLLRPLDQPDYALVWYEGPVNGPIRLPPLPRDVARAYTCLTTPAGEEIEAGPLRHDPELGWHFLPENQTDPRLQDVIAFTLVLGPPHVNA